MFLKFKREEITWIDQKYLTKEFAKDIASFWIKASNNKVYCARYNDDKTISHWFFDENKLEWIFDYNCDDKPFNER